jgi:hypothetical protein
MRVAIVCGAPSSEFLAPYDDKDVEIWVLGNRADRHLSKRVTRIFEIHDNLSEHKDPKRYENWVLAQELPVVAGEKNFAGCVVERFPYKKVEELYGSLYLTSSPAYMMAYAILKGATEIQIYGVDLSVSDHEYFWQRPCMEAWIGFAKGRGIKVVIPEVSHVGKSRYVEGRDWNGDTEVGVFSEEEFGAQALDCATKREVLQKQRQELAIKAAALDGAEQVYRHLAKVARAVEAQVDVKSLSEATVLR